VGDDELTSRLPLVVVVDLKKNIYI